MNMHWIVNGLTLLVVGFAGLTEALLSVSPDTLQAFHAWLSGISELVTAESCEYGEIRNCTDGIFYFERRSTIGVGDTGFNNDCKMFAEGLNCVRSFADKCFAGIKKGVTRTMLEAMQEINEQLCTNGTQLNKDFLAASACVNSLGEKIRGQMRWYLNTLDFILKSNQERDRKVHQTCCLLPAYNKRIRAVIQGKCGKEANVLFSPLSSILEKSGGDIICASYKCPKNKLDFLPEVPNSNSTEPKHGIFVSVFRTLDVATGIKIVD